MTKKKHPPEGELAEEFPRPAATAGLDATTATDPLPATTVAEPASEAVKLAELTAKLAETEDRRLRLAADFDNYRKRVFRDLQEARTAAQTDTLLPMLNVFDHFLLAMTAAEANPAPQVLREGMTMILAEFRKALEDLDIELIEAVGRPFDPQLHEASARETSATVPENQIIRQWRCGYRRGQRLIRPATVVISSGPAVVAPATTATEQDS